MPHTDLRNKTIAITGASSGIGAVLARDCARLGMRVALMARRADKLEAVADECRALGARAWTYAGSVDDQDQLREFVEIGQHDLAPFDVAVANAGYGIERPTLELTDDEHRRMWEVNFWHSLALARMVVPAMTERGSGHVVFISSCLAKLGLPCYAAYCATKAAQDHYARALRHELAPSGVAVTSVHPIGTKTEFFEEAAKRSGGLRLMDRAQERTMQPPERVTRAIIKRLRTGRGGEVWTTPLARIPFALATLMPGLTDRALKTMYRKRHGKAARAAASSGASPSTTQ